MFCQNCGGHIQEGSAFCSACGYPVDKNVIVDAYQQITRNNTIAKYRKLRVWSIIGALCATLGIILLITGMNAHEETMVSTSVYIYFIGATITGWQALHKWKSIFFIFIKFIIAAMIGFLGFSGITLYYCLKKVE